MFMKIGWRKSAVNCLVLLALIVGGLGLIPAARVVAQIACDPDAGTDVASPAKAATPVAAVDVTFPQQGGELRVFAAASLVDAFGEIGGDIQEANPNVSITIETAGSQTLVTQLQEGAEADVLATANASTMTTAVESGLIEGDPQAFTGNRLVIVTPDGNPAGIESIDDLAGDDINLVVAAADVPVGNYSRDVLCSYGTSADAPEGFIDAVNDNIVSEELDVRSVLAKVHLEEADAGLVYASDAVAANLADTPVTVVEFPDTLNVTATYPIAPVAGGNVELANAFIAYVLSEPGQATLERYGFVRP
jgi:molybdate transport system substrate-binding protein